MFRLEKKSELNMVSTLPPETGVSDYTLSLVRIIQEIEGVSLFFWGFKSLYPKMFLKKVKSGLEEPQLADNVVVHNVLSWWNLLVAIFLPITMKGNILHMQFWSPATVHIYLPVALSAKFFGKTLIITVHNSEPHENNWGVLKSKNLFARVFNLIISRIISTLIKLYMNLGDHFILHNERSAKAFNKLYPNKNISIIPHPIIDNYPLRKIPKSVARGKLGLPKDKKIILFFGNIRKYKGIEDVIELFKKLDHSEYHLLIAGRVWKEMAGILEDSLRELYPHTYTFFPRFIESDELEQIFVSSDLLLLSHKEFSSASGVLTLATFYNLPVIATSIFKAESSVDFTVKKIAETPLELLEEAARLDVDKRSLILTVQKEIVGKYVDLINRINQERTYFNVLIKLIFTVGVVFSISLLTMYLLDFVALDIGTLVILTSVVLLSYAILLFIKRRGFIHKILVTLFLWIGIFFILGSFLPFTAAMVFSILVPIYIID